MAEPSEKCVLRVVRHARPPCLAQLALLVRRKNAGERRPHPRRASLAARLTAGRPRSRASHLRRALPLHHRHGLGGARGRGRAQRWVGPLFGDPAGAISDAPRPRTHFTLRGWVALTSPRVRCADFDELVKLLLVTASADARAGARRCFKRLADKQCAPAAASRCRRR